MNGEAVCKKMDEWSWRIWNTNFKVKKDRKIIYFWLKQKSQNQQRCGHTRTSAQLCDASFEGWYRHNIYKGITGSQRHKNDLALHACQQTVHQKNQKSFGQYLTMKGLKKVLLMGNLGKDPKFKS